MAVRVKEDVCENTLEKQKTYTSTQGMAEFLRCSLETITTLLTGYTPV